MSRCAEPTPYGVVSFIAGFVLGFLLILGLGVIMPSAAVTDSNDAFTRSISELDGNILRLIDVCESKETGATQ